MISSREIEIKIPKVSIAEYAIGYSWLNELVGAYSKYPVELRSFYNTSKTMNYRSKWWIYWLGQKKRSSNGNTPLHDAVGSEDLSRFLSLCCNTEVKNNVGATPLHDAAWKGDLEAARLLVEAGANLSAINRSGATALHDAAWCGHTNIVKLLVDAGAPLEIKNTNFGRTPLGDAAYSYMGRADTVEFLLEKGAKKDVRNFLGKTPLQEATIMKRHDKIALLK